MLQQSRFSVYIRRADNLLPKNGNMVRDVYVKLKLNNNPKRKTKVVMRKLHPKFNEWFDLDGGWAEGDFLVISVWAANNWGPNEFLGQLQFERPKDPTGHQEITSSLRPDCAGHAVQPGGCLSCQQRGLHLRVQELSRRGWEPAPDDSAHELGGWQPARASHPNGDGVHNALLGGFG